MGLPKRKKFKWSMQDEAIQNHVNNDRGLTWTSSNGKTQSIAIMDSNYIKNAIAKVERGEKNGGKFLLPVLKLELIYRQICNINEN